MRDPAFPAVGEEFLIRGDGRGVVGEPSHAIHQGRVQQILRSFSRPAFTHGEKGQAAGRDARNLPRRHLARLAAAVGKRVHDSHHARLAISGELLSTAMPRPAAVRPTKKSTAPSRLAA